MKSRTHCSVNSVARRVSRAMSAGIACIGLALVGCGGLTPMQQDQLTQASVQNSRYTIQDLGVVGINSSAPGQPLVIANNGLISGAAGIGSGGSGPEHAVFWQDGQRIDIGDPGLGGNSFGYGVNESGTEAGEAETAATGLSTTEDFCAFEAEGLSVSPAPCVPFVWTGSQMVPLPTLGGVNGIANEINNSGMIAGYAETSSIDPGCASAKAAPQQYQFKPVVWSHGKAQPLSTGSDMDGVAYSINDRGQAVGASGSCAPLNLIWGFYINPNRALLWQDGVATDLGDLGGGPGNNFAHHLNNLGQVVGFSGRADGFTHAFLWPGPDNKMQDLGTVNDKVDDDAFSFGLGINDAGQITGVSASSDFSIIRAFVRQNGSLTDLNSLVTGANSLYLMTACSINSRGQIIGIAVDENTGETHGYLATPAHGAAANSNAVRPPVLPDWVRAQFSRFAKHP